MGFARLGTTVKRGQQMAPYALKEPSGQPLVLNRVMIVSLALKENIVINLVCSLRLQTVNQVTTAQQKKIFALQNQAISYVQLAITVQRELPTQ